MPRSVTRYKVRNHRGVLIAVHGREDNEDGTKRVWWEQPDGTPGLPKGVGVVDLPLFGSELVKTIPVNKALVVCEGEKDALALRAGGIPALATVTGAATAPTPKAMAYVAWAARFILWPDADKAGLDHMKMVAQNLWLAGARHVQIIRYKPGDGAEWGKGFGAADVVTPDTAKVVLGWLVEDWASTARRPSARKANEPTPDDGDVIVVGRQMDKGSVTGALMEAFGLHATPGKSVQCPMHDDRSASLSVLRDDLRAICYAPCQWGTPGVTASDIRAAKKEPVT